MGTRISHQPVNSNNQNRKKGMACSRRCRRRRTRFERRQCSLKGVEVVQDGVDGLALLHGGGGCGRDDGEDSKSAGDEGVEQHDRV